MVVSRQQVFRPGELPLVLLALLKDAPRNGHELMGELTRLFDGYRASPGSVYPAVSALEAEGLLRVEEANGRKSYRLTRIGVQALERRRDVLAAIEVRTGARLSADGSLVPAIERFTSRVLHASGRVDPAAVERILEEAAAAVEALGGTNGERRDRD